MAVAHSFPIALDRCFRNDFFNVRDPGSAGTISWNNKGKAICEVVTAGAESRALSAASGFGVGTPLTVILKVDGGDLTITGALGGSVVLDTAGDLADFVVVKTDAAGTKAWKLVVSAAAVASANAVTRATAAAAANLVPVSAGADKALTAATPIDITGDLSAYNETTFKAVLTALAGFGLITDSTTT